MKTYKGFYADEYNTVYCDGEHVDYSVGKLCGDTLEDWVDDYLETEPFDGLGED